MYETQSNACDLPNSESPMSQGRIDGQSRRMDRIGSRFVRGNRAMANVCAALTPPAPSASCDDLETSAGMYNISPWPLPNPNGVSDSGVLSFEDFISSLVGGTSATPAAAAAAAAASSSSTVEAGSVGTSVPAPGGSHAGNRRAWRRSGAGRFPYGAPGAIPAGSAPGAGRAGSGWPARDGAPGARNRNSMVICIPKIGLSGYHARPRGMSGLGDYLGSPTVTLFDGTVITDPANTEATDAECLPFQCGKDPSNAAARYWCAYWARTYAPAPCDTDCAAYAPAYCTPAAGPAIAPAPPAVAPPAPVYPYSPLQTEIDTYVPPRCGAGPGGALPAVGSSPAAGPGANQTCFSLASPTLWGTVLALGIGAWLVSGK